MTEFLKNWKIWAGITAAVVLLGGGFGLGGFALAAPIPVGPNPPCDSDSGQLVHYDKIMFITPANKLVAPPPHPIIKLGQLYEIKVVDEFGTVGDLRKMVQQDLVGKGYMTGNGGLVKRNMFFIIDVDYAVACHTNPLPT